MQDRRFREQANVSTVLIPASPVGRRVGGERKLARAPLRESEARYRTIFDLANDAIFLQDLDTGAILDVNQRMVEMYGWTRDEAVQLTIADLSAEEPP